MKSFKQLMSEMSQHLPDKYQLPNDVVQKRSFDQTKDWPLHDHQIDHPDIKIHKQTSNDHTIIVTNDHKVGKTLHQTTIEHHSATNGHPLLRFKHDIQNDVWKVPSKKLPSSHAANLALHHARNSDVPLTASIAQYADGHKMWRNISHKALDSGLHVYHHNREHLQKSTKENLDSHLGKLVILRFAIRI